MEEGECRVDVYMLRKELCKSSARSSVQIVSEYNDKVILND